MKHDTAFATARVVCDIFAPLLRPEEQNEAFGQVYEAIRAGLDWLEAEQRKEARRLAPIQPSEN